MPIYDYACANCGHLVEVVHGVHEAGPTVCPECGGLLRKRISPPAIHFRGSGWAKKDARDASTARAGRTAKGHGQDASAHKDGAGASEGGKREGGKREGGKNESGASGASKGSD